MEIYRPDGVPEFTGGPDMTAVNERAIESAKKQIHELANEIVDLVYEGISEALRTDKEMFDRLRPEESMTNEVVGTHVKQDSLLTGPFINGEPTRTFFTHLEANSDTLDYVEDADVSDPVTEEVPDTTGRHRYMRIHVPAGSNSISHFKMPSYREIQEVYIELAEEDHIRWLGVTRTGLLYEYTPPKQQDKHQQNETSDDLWRDFNDRVPQSLETLTEIFRHIANWDTKPQEIRIIK